MIHLKKLQIACLPTVVEPMPRLSAALGGPTLFIKRDDQTGLALGGNKTRKLEYLLADAREKGARTLITAGAVQSNHCRQTAAAAARAGMVCILVLTGEKPQTLSGNLLIDKLMNVDIRWTTRETRDDTLQKVFEEVKAAGGEPYLIPYGGSNPIGASAYVFAIEELLDQGCHPDWIVFASSSGGTQAGLIAGARIFGYGGKILGISVDEKEQVLRERIANLAQATADLLGEILSFNAQDVLVNDAYLGGGYGVAGELEREAIQITARSEGLLVDPVYTGRAIGGMIDLIRKDFFKKGERVLFWHTGGTPALFADNYRNLV